MGQFETRGGKLPEKVTINYFDFKHVIGRGGFGKVWKVVCKKNGKEYAMKVMSKVKIIDRKSQKSILSERHLLSKLCHPFLVNMVYSFQDADHLYLVMDLLTGGDLRYHISRTRSFTQEQTKFFLACLILGLEYIHNNLVIHRDIKPENLVCDDKGYIRITDFGVAKRFRKDNASETSGTPGYMAPEVLCAKNHSYPVDYFALGIISYEFMLGKRPYHGRSRKEVKQDVIGKQVQIKSSEIPGEWPLDSVDFTNNLIQRKQNQRLGYNGIYEIKQHPWFEDFPWSSLMNKKLESPFIPKNGDNFDKHYCEGDDKLGDETKERYHLYKKSESYDIVFCKYTFNNIPQDEYISLYNQNNRTNSSNTIGSSNTTISSIKRTTSTSSMKEINKINLSSMVKLKLKAYDFSLLNQTKFEIGNSIKNFPSNNLPQNSTLKMKGSFLTPSALLYHNNPFYLIDRNLPIIKSASKKQIKKSSSTQSIFPGKSQLSRPQTNISSKDNNIQNLMNAPMNIRQVKYTNNLMGSTMVGKQMKRNKSTTALNSGLSSTKSINN